MINCVNLYTQTEYTLLSSLIKVKSLGSVLNEYKYDACAIVDENMSGVIKFYKMCENNNIKPLIGLHFIFNNKINNTSLLLYAMNEIGYHNLMNISSLKSLNPDLTLNDIKVYTYGILAIIPSSENEIIKYFLNNAISKAKEILNEYKTIFNVLYLGIDLQTPASIEVVDELINFGKRENLEAVALNKSTYFNSDDCEAYKVLRSVATGNKNYELNILEKNSRFLSVYEMNALFKDYPILLENTIKIKNQLNVTIKFHEFKFPKYDVINSKQYLEDLCKVGLKRRLEQNHINDYKTYGNRLFYELDVINKMGFNDYFLIVYDYVKYAKKNGIFVGAGRGSAGGSLVSYAIGITDIDPVKYGLLFERFLNIERVTMPDIDVDFPSDKRSDVIRYIGNKYGINRVAHINTFQTMKAKQSIRDVARVMDLSDVKLNEVFKYFPKDNEKKNLELLKDIINNSKELTNLLNDDDINYLFKISMKLEGFPRNSSTHASGIIMADTNLTNYTPLQTGINGLNQTQYEASDLEALGLLKMDVLGVDDLTVIKNVVDDVEARYNVKLNLNSLEPNDPKVFSLLRNGLTLGLFQLKSNAVSELLVNLKCSSFNDIVNSIALYRPGPKSKIPLFVERKFGKKYELIHPSLKDILKDTYGIIVYQEQIMLIARVFAGYSLGEADILRHAVSKKKANILKEEREKFVKRSVMQGHSEKMANEIYDDFEDFSEYGLNKSHAVAYALILYQMAYLKTYYFKSFMTSLMSNNVSSIDELEKYIKECKKFNIKVLPPDINISSKKFNYTDEGIFFPLIGITSIGSEIASKILDERNNGPFVDFKDFVYRTKDIINKAQFNNLVFSNSLDCFKLTKKGMIEGYDFTLQKAIYKDTLKDMIINVSINDDEYSFIELSEKEKEALRVNLKYELFARHIPIRERYNLLNLNSSKINAFSKSIAIIKNIKEIKTKNNDLMAFVSLYDDSCEIDGVIFPKTYLECKNILKINEAYIINYKKEIRNEKVQAIIQTIYNLK